MITFSKEMMLAMKFEEHSPPIKIHAKFGLLKIYSIKRINFVDENELRIGALNEQVRFGIGNSINLICQAMFDDIFIEDEKQWMQQNAVTKPLLLTYTTNDRIISKDAVWVNFSADSVTTYDTFRNEKELTDKLANKWEVPSVLQLGAELSAEGRFVTILHKVTERIARTEDGRKLEDFRLTSYGNVEVSQSVPIDDALQTIKDVSARIVELGERVPRLMRSAIQETDNMKAFLFAWMALEVLINKNFNGKVSEFPIIDIPTKMSRWESELFKNKKRGLEITSIAQKFLYLIIFEWKIICNQDMVNFMDFKKRRDSIAHGDAVDYSQLPTTLVLELINKIIRAKSANKI